MFKEGAAGGRDTRDVFKESVRDKDGYGSVAEALKSKYGDGDGGVKGRGGGREDDDRGNGRGGGRGGREEVLKLGGGSSWR